VVESVRRFHLPEKASWKLGPESVPGKERTDVAAQRPASRHPSGRLVSIAVVLPLKPSFTTEPLHCQTNTSSSAFQRKAVWSQPHFSPKPTFSETFSGFLHQQVFLPLSRAGSCSFLPHLHSSQCQPHFRSTHHLRSTSRPTEWLANRNPSIMTTRRRST